jgi:hypothetical protein
VGVPIGLTFDAGDPERLGTFWCLALGYMERPPPEGYDSWEQYDAANGTPGNEAGYSIVDPDGKGPSIFFQPVPEPKTAKNRLHMDVRVSAGLAGASEEERRARIEAAVAPLVAAGATMRNRSTDPDDFFIVMLDPEGNEFCLV